MKVLAQCLLAHSAPSSLPMEVAQISPPSGSLVHLLGPRQSQMSDHLSRQVKHPEEPEVRVEKLGDEEKRSNAMERK